MQPCIHITDMLYTCLDTNARVNHRKYNPEYTGEERLAKKGNRRRLKQRFGAQTSKVWYSVDLKPVWKKKSAVSLYKQGQGLGGFVFKTETIHPLPHIHFGVCKGTGAYSSCHKARTELTSSYPQCIRCRANTERQSFTPKRNLVSPVNLTLHTERPAGLNYELSYCEATGTSTKEYH